MTLPVGRPLPTTLTELPNKTTGMVLFPDLREQNQVFINSDLITVLFGCMCVCV